MRGLVRQGKAMQDKAWMLLSFEALRGSVRLGPSG